MMNIFKKKAHVLGLLFLTVNFSAAGQTADFHSTELQWEHYDLPNGMSVLLQPAPERSDVSIEFWLHTGTADEKPDQHGLAHFFEHATPYGLQDAGEETLAKFRENMNFSNAQTRPDFTRYHIQVNPKVLELGLRYVSDRLKADTMAITEEWVERHRRNVLREFDRQTKHPLWGGEQDAMRAAGTFGEAHPYGHSGYGSRENNEKFGAHDFREWYEKYVNAENTTLFVVGNFETGETKALINNYFSGIHVKDKGGKVGPVSPKQKEIKETVKAPTEDHTFIMSWAVPGFGSEDDPALYLLANILNARLSKTDSRPRSVTDAGASTALYKMAGEFYIYVTFSALTDSLDAERYLKKNFQELLSERVSDDDLKRALEAEAEYVRGAIDNKRMGMWSSRTELLGEGLLFTGNPDYYLQRLKNQQELTSGNIRQAAKKWLDNRPYQLLVISGSSN